MSGPNLFAAVERFLAWCETNRSPKTTAGYRHYLERFQRWAGDVALASLTPAQLGTWATKYHPVQAVQRLAAWCHRVDKSLPVNPLAGMEKPATGERRRTLRRAELVTMMRAADPVFRRLAIALRESGMRPQEARAVWWEDLLSVDGDEWTEDDIRGGRAYFALPEGKGFARRKDKSAIRVVAISPRFGRLLVRLSRRRPVNTGPIFLNRLLAPWTANAVRCRMRRLRLSLGMVADRRGERVVAYTFRHTFATAAVRAGIRDFRLAEGLGHATPRTSKRYVHLVPDDICEAMGKVWEVKAADRAKKRRPGSAQPRPDDAR